MLIITNKGGREVSKLQTLTDKGEKGGKESSATQIQMPLFVSSSFTAVSSMLKSN